jgi:hypothetical protein
MAASIIRAIIALMMEAARTSETLVNFYQTTWCYNPEDSHLPHLILFIYLRLMTSRHKRVNILNIQNNEKYFSV